MVGISQIKLKYAGGIVIAGEAAVVKVNLSSG